MNPENKEYQVRKILVPLDDSGHSLSALETAATLASALNAELKGLFVEDHELFQVAQLPIFREVSPLAPKSRRLEPDHLARALKVQADKLRRIIASKAEEARVQWTFDVCRGGVPSEVQEHSLDVDMTVLGKAGRACLSAPRLGSTVRKVITQSKGLTLVLQEGLGLESPVLTLYSGSALSRRAMQVALSVAKAVQGEVLALIPAQSQQDYLHKQNSLTQEFAESPVQIYTRQIKNIEIDILLAVVQAEQGRPFILPVEEEHFNLEELQGLMNRLKNPVLLVRSPGQSPG